MSSPFKVLSPAEYAARVSSASAAPPGLSWSGGNPTILSENDVNERMAKYAPDTHEDMMKETRSMRRQSFREHPIHPDADDFVEYTKIEAHDLNRWTEEVFPDMGHFEVCELVKPILTDRQYLAFYGSYFDGLPIVQVAERLMINRATVAARLAEVRSVVIAALSDGRLAFSKEEDQTDHENIEALMVGATPPNKTRLSPAKSELPKVKVRICPKCSKHLDHTRLDHQKNEDGKERYLKCICGARYPQSEWSRLLT